MHLRMSLGSSEKTMNHTRSDDGKVLDWLNTGVHKHFSNFLFVDKRYGSDQVMRRVFSEEGHHFGTFGDVSAIMKLHSEHRPTEGRFPGPGDYKIIGSI